VVIVKDTNVVFCKGYGVRAAGAPELVDEHTVFRIGSLSKGFAAGLTAVLVQEGKLNWQDKVTQYYPAFALRDPAQTQRLRLVHVLSHTTGLPHHAHTDMIENGYTMQQILPYLKKVKVCAKEGTQFCYQNAVYSVIGEVIYAATGQTYQDLLEAKVFRPLGMSSASVRYETLMATENKAYPHIPTANGWTKTDISEKYYNSAPAGGVNASGTDMGAWMKLLLGQHPDRLNTSTLDSLFAPCVRTYGERRFFGGWGGDKSAYYAKGWRVLQRTGHPTIVSHSGYVNGFRGEIALDRTNKVGICVLFNANSPWAQRCIPAFFEKAALVY
jgi:beta-lactamase class C